MNWWHIALFVVISCIIDLLLWPIFSIVTRPVSKLFEIVDLRLNKSRRREHANIQRRRRMLEKWLRKSE